MNKGNDQRNKLDTIEQGRREFLKSSAAVTGAGLAASAVPGFAGDAEANRECTGDATAYLQYQLDTTGFLELPPYDLEVSSLILSDGQVIRGRGKGLSRLLKIPGSSEPLIRCGGGGVIRNVEVSDLALIGVDTDSGVGLLLDGVQQSHFRNLLIDRFRGSDDAGIGVSMITDVASCNRNTFLDVAINNCDTALQQEHTGTSNASCGYCAFLSLTIGMEKYGVRLLGGTENGGKYNTFSHLFMQGTGTAEYGIYCEGAGNCFVKPSFDGPFAQAQVHFAEASSGNALVHPVPWTPGKIVNKQTKGARNVIYYQPDYGAAIPVT